MVEIEFKAVGSVATTNGTNANVPTLQGTQDAALGNIGLRKIDILGLFSRLSTNQASYAYTEAVPKDGDYGFVEEGKLKPQVDFKWDTRYATPLKVAAHMVLTAKIKTLSLFTPLKFANFSSFNLWNFPVIIEKN